MRSGVIALWVALCALGCVAQSAFTPTGFKPQERKYEIGYLAETESLTERGWRIANYQYSKGVPTEEMTKGRFTSTFPWELADGSPSKIETTTYELLIEHNTNATIWVRLVPTPRSLQGKMIRVLAENYVNNLTGNVYSDYFDPEPSERRISTKILESESTRVMDHGAQRVRFEIVNLDQLEHDANAPRTQAEIILVNVVHKKKARGRNVSHVPALFLLGYANDAAMFDTHYPDFRDLVDRIRAAPADTGS